MKRPAETAGSSSRDAQPLDVSLHDVAPHDVAPHDVLTDLLLERGPPHARGARVSACGLRSLIEHARANDVALQAYACLERLQPGILDLDPGIAAHARHMRRRADLIERELPELSRIAQSIGHSIAIMKGVGVARLYPPHWARVQRDIDVLVPGLEALSALWPELLAAGYAHEVVAVRYGAEGDLQMSVAFVRDEDRPGRIEVWMGSQPTSWWSARSIGEAFWARARPVPELPGLVLPAVDDALFTLVGEVHERGQIRMRDVFDFCALSAQMEPESWSAACSAIAGVLPVAFDGLLEEARRYRGLPWSVRWTPHADDGDGAHLPRDLPTRTEGGDDARGLSAMRAGKFVPLAPVSAMSGPFALADTEFGAALRTPCGTFLER